MKVEQIYTGCLAEAAYYIESQGEAAVIDPLRDPRPYIERAEQDKAKIKYVLETHFHADFVSGHLDLARATGATIVYGPNAETAFDAYIAKDGEELKLGKATIRVIHTPGHTLESTTYLLIDENGKEHAIFTGDTLFIGDVGRPDLAVKSDLTKEDLASLLYDSLRNKIMPLPDHLIVYPAHGAGSACGKSMSKETFDTLGNQKKFNYALRSDMSREEFIHAVLEGLTPPPQYFPKNAVLNRKGYPSFETVEQKGLVAHSVDEFIETANQHHALILDTRSPDAFASGHIPGSVFIGIDGNFAPWAGALIPDLNQPILFVADEGREQEVVMRLSRVGFDNTLGYLKGGMESWRQAGRPIETCEEITAEDLKKLYSENPDALNIVDVRNRQEYFSNRLNKALHLPLDQINSHMRELDRNARYFIHCAGGYRSMIALSILKGRGYRHLVNIKGGFKAIADTGLPVVSGPPMVTT
ncbi:MAG: MBL fold metallo-hydrolase [Chitinophagales bacterium]|nr:MAG: MBL fold metallo-hydrolase [Chitinophagales bacterium]